MAKIPPVPTPPSPFKKVSSTAVEVRDKANITEIRLKAGMKLVFDGE